MAEQNNSAIHEALEGNQMKIRETLVAVKKSIDGIGASSLDGDSEILMMSLTQVCARLSSRIETALSEPARNCDVGTAQEQAERYSAFCSRFPKCTGCPCCGKMRYNNCQFTWEQMPYEGKEKSNG